MPSTERENTRLRKGSGAFGAVTFAVSCIAAKAFVKSKPNDNCPLNNNKRSCKSMLLTFGPQMTDVDYTFMAYLIFSVILAAILLIGVKYNNSKVIFIYLCGGIINVIALVFLFGFLMSTITSTDQWWYCLAILIPFIYAYAWVIVQKYYKELMKKPTNRRDTEALAEL